MSFQRRMLSLPLSEIKLTDSFWKRWQRVLVDVTLPTQYQQLVDTGRISNFHRAAKSLEGGFQGLWFNDSDVYKFVEACAYALTIHDSPELRGNLSSIIDAIGGAQEADGYINTFFQLRFPNLKWRNLHMMHEMYCGGHLIEAGVAMFECLNDRRLMDIAIRFADHVMSVFGPGKRRGYCGHEEIELALIRLTNATGDKKYAEFATWLVEERGRDFSPFEAELSDQEALNIWPNTHSTFLKDGKYNGEYAQDHAPIREHEQVVGHAVRAMYLYIAAADLAAGQEDEAMELALRRAWNNLTRHRMYITGGIGPSSSNEGFTADYDLPNLTAYAETCASCGLIFWGQKMLEMTADSEFVDVIEQALYNGALSGLSLSGDHYFYANPLESRGTHARTPWFTCACCPPNIARLIGALGHYVVGASSSEFFIHIPVGLEATVVLGGVDVQIKVESDYPWSGKLKIRVDPKQPASFRLMLRIPNWSEDMETELPGADDEAGYDNGYAVFDRTWNPGDFLSVDLGMEPRWVESDPRVRDNLGRVALMNGPLVYALEEHDLGYAPQLFSAEIDAPIEVAKQAMLDGINVLSVEGTAEVEDDSDELYSTEGTIEIQSATAKFIPYYAWNNRGATNMQVWVRRN